MPNRPSPDRRKLRNVAAPTNRLPAALSDSSNVSNDKAGADASTSVMHDVCDEDEDPKTPARPIHDFFDTRHSSRVAYQTVLGMVQGFATTICIARSLAAGEREIDLSGLHEAAGILCARALDLRPEHGRQLVPRLQSVLEDLDALHTILAPARMCSATERD